MITNSLSDKQAWILISIVVILLAIPLGILLAFAYLGRIVIRLFETWKW